MARRLQFGCIHTVYIHTYIYVYGCRKKAPAEGTGRKGCELIQSPPPPRLYVHFIIFIITARRRKILIIKNIYILYCRSPSPPPPVRLTHSISLSRRTRCHVSPHANSNDARCHITAAAVVVVVSRYIGRYRVRACVRACPLRDENRVLSATEILDRASFWRIV